MKDEMISKLTSDVVGIMRDFRKKSGKPDPEPDTYDAAVHNFGVVAGDNKMEQKVCPTCGKPPTKMANMPNDVFLFRDKMSVTEYGISGMCQACQDRTFT